MDIAGVNKIQIFLANGECIWFYIRGTIITPNANQPTNPKKMNGNIFFIFLGGTCNVIF